TQTSAPAIYLFATNDKTVKSYGSKLLVFQRLYWELYRAAKTKDKDLSAGKTS
ncbi:unnamed protein product, partial [marine sediment metagenome]